MERKSSSKKSSKASTNLNELKVVDLKKICKEMGIACPSKKADIILAIIDARSRGAAEEIELPLKTKKSSPQKSPVKMSPPRHNYDEMDMAQLKKECKKRQLQDKNKKCPNLSKERLVALLKTWDGYGLPEKVKPESGSKSGSEREESIEVEIKTKRSSSKTKKSSSTSKTKAKKSSPVKLSPPRYNYDEMDMVQLKKECKKRQLQDKNRKCPNMSKDRLVAMLKMWDGLGLPREVKPESKESVKTKRSSRAKSPKKRSSSKSKSPQTKSPKTKTKRCDDKEDFLKCDEGTVCSASSGKCVKSTKSSRSGKVELHVDGRIIVGSEETLKNLQKILGGDLVGKLRYQEKAGKGFKGKKASPEAVGYGHDEDVEEELIKFEEKEKQRWRETMSAKKKGGLKGSPDIMDIVHGKEESEEERLEDLLKKSKRKSPVKARVKKESPSKRKTSQKILKERDLVQTTFEECLASLE